jgi:molybdopterin-guanine dinucleotide biosynthesis protein A
VASKRFPAGYSMCQIAAVVLAGGRGERLGGVNKAFIEIDGRTLLDRVRGAIAGCTPRLLAVGRRPFDAPGFVNVPDLDIDLAGPLAGLVSAVEALAGSGTTHLVSLAVDSPSFPADFLRRASRVIADRDVAVGGYRGQLYPTNALWRLAALRDLPARARAGSAPRSLRRLCAELDCVHLDYAETTPEDPFASVNTAGDLARLRVRDGLSHAGQMSLGKANQILYTGAAFGPANVPR